VVSEGDADPEERVGELIAGKYQLRRLLGAGGMGAVYEAEHSFTKRTVAVKLMHEMFVKSKVLAERFIREARAPGAIGHKGIVEVLDGGYDDDGGLYLVLEMLEGQELTDAYESLSLKEMVGICGDLLDALGAAHAAGFVHRDIKPDNVFLAQEGTTRRVKLLDFGVAGLLESEESTHLTKTGTILGTPMFMSPEQAKGDKVDHRADLWAVGAILYDALAGHPPYQGESYNALIVSIVTREHIPLSHVRPDLPRELLEVIDRTLRKDPQKRYQSAEEMAGALRAIPHGEAQSGVVVRRKPEEVATRVERQRDGTSSEGESDSPAQMGVAATRLSEPMPQAALKMTAPTPATVPSGAPHARRVQQAPTPTPMTTHRTQSRPQQPQSSGMGLWIGAGVALIAIAVGVVVAASRTAQPAEASAIDSAAVAAVAGEPEVLPADRVEAADVETEPPPSEQLPPAAERVYEAATEQQPKPQPAAAAAPTARPLGTDDLTAVLSREQANIQRCYLDVMNAALVAGGEPPPALSVHISLTVAGTGHVTSVSVEGPTPAGLSACIEQRVRGWRFRASGEKAKLSFPAVFQPKVVGR